MNFISLAVTSDKELQLCFHIRREVFVHEQQVPEQLEIDEFDSSVSASHHFLLVDSENNNEPVAAARWRLYNNYTAKLQRIAVLSAYRGIGLGKQIIEAMEQDIRKNDHISMIILDAQLQAEAFYTKLGYERESSDTFLDAGIVHIRMIKKIGG